MTDHESESPEEPRANEKPAMVKRSGLKNYFLEFLMVFLGITSGFFVDNFREERDERTQETDYMRSLLVDLQKDRETFNYNADHGSQLTIMYHDSLNAELQKRPLQGREKRIYHFYLLYNTGGGFNYHDRTVAQLKYSAKFRLIRRQAVADAIIDYDNFIIKSKSSSEGIWHLNIANNTNLLITRIFDLAVVSKFGDLAQQHMTQLEKVNYPDNLKLKNYNDDEIGQLLNWMVLGRNDDLQTLRSLRQAIKMNEKLDSLIRKEYFN